MDRFEDVRDAKPGTLLSVSTPDGLHVVGTVESVDGEARTLSFVGGKVVAFAEEEKAPAVVAADAPEEGGA